MVEKWVDLDEKSKKKNKKFREILRVILPKSLQRKKKGNRRLLCGSSGWKNVYYLKNINLDKRHLKI